MGATILLGIWVDGTRLTLQALARLALALARGVLDQDRELGWEWRAWLFKVALVVETWMRVTVMVVVEGLLVAEAAEDAVVHAAAEPGVVVVVVVMLVRAAGTGTAAAQLLGMQETPESLLACPEKVGLIAAPCKAVRMALLSSARRYRGLGVRAVWSLIGEGRINS